MSRFHFPSFVVGTRLASVLALLAFGFSSTTVSWATTDWERAVEAYKGGNLAVAIEELRAVVEAHPDYAPGHSFLGVALYRSGQAEESVEPLQRGLELDSSDEASRLVLVRAFIELERLDEATTVVRRIEGAKLRPDQRHEWSEALRLLASRAPDPRSLLPSLSSSVERFPKDAGLWTALGRLQERLELPGEVLLSLAKAARLEQTSERRTRYLETALRFGEAGLEGGTEGYRLVAEEAETWDGVAAETALLVAECWLGAGSCEAASPWLEQATSGPSAATALLYRGQCAAAARNYRAAIPFLETARSKSSEDAVTLRLILLALGDAYHAEHRFEAAARVFSAAGDPERVAAMELAQEATLHNAALDLEVAKCRERRAKVDDLLAEHRDTMGTADWVALVKSYEEQLSDCRAYL